MKRSTIFVVLATLFSLVMSAFTPSIIYAQTGCGGPFAGSQNGVLVATWPTYDVAMWHTLYQPGTSLYVDTVTDSCGNVVGQAGSQVPVADANNALNAADEFLLQLKDAQSQIEALKLENQQLQARVAQLEAGDLAAASDDIQNEVTGTEFPLPPGTDPVDSRLPAPQSSNNGILYLVLAVVFGSFCVGLALYLNYRNNQEAEEGEPELPEDDDIDPDLDALVDDGFEVGDADDEPETVAVIDATPLTRDDGEELIDG